MKKKLKIKPITEPTREEINLKRPNNPKNKKKVVALVLILIAVVILCVVPYFTIQMINEGQLEHIFPLDDALKSQNQTTHYVGDIVRSNPKIVHYPIVENETLQANLKANAKTLLNKVQSRDSVQNIDYTSNIINQKYLSLSYSLGDATQLDLYTLDGQKLGADIIDDTLKKRIFETLRFQAKQDEHFSDYAYSVEFAQKTASQSYPYVFTLMDGQLQIFFDNLLNDQDFMINLPLSSYGGHLALELEAENSGKMANISPAPHYVDPNRPMVALTFDDGPRDPSTSALLDILYEYDATSTFFVLGNAMLDGTYDNLLIRSINNGNEIGNHSISHSDLAALMEKDTPENREKLSRELNSVSNYINTLTNGAYQVALFRPPYGSTNEKVRSASPHPLAMWNRDPRDWDVRNAQAVYDRVLGEAADGAIYVLHDIHPETVEAMKTAIPALKEAGYQIVTFSQMMEAKGETMVNGGRYP